MSLPATQLVTQSSTELATKQVVNKIVSFEEALEIATLTPLPKAFEYRYCLAEFSSNSQLYYYVRESHGKKIVSSTVYSTVKNSASSSASRIISPPIYRAVLSPPPVYQATLKAYLIVQNLYMRYASLKSIHSALKIRVASYLIV